MKTLQIQMFYDRPHPGPLPRGEGTAVGNFAFRASFFSRWPRSICQVTGGVSPSPWGEGRGEGGCRN
jgi:hypothetical protein